MACVWKKERFNEFVFNSLPSFPPWLLKESYEWLLVSLYLNERFAFSRITGIIVALQGVKHNGKTYIDLLLWATLNTCEALRRFGEWKLWDYHVNNRVENGIFTHEHVCTAKHTQKHIHWRTRWNQCVCVCMSMLFHKEQCAPLIFM